MAMRKFRNSIVKRQNIFRINYKKQIRLKDNNMSTTATKRLPY